MNYYKNCPTTHCKCTQPMICNNGCYITPLHQDNSDNSDKTDNGDTQALTAPETILFGGVVLAGTGICAAVLGYAWQRFFN